MYIIWETYFMSATWQNGQKHKHSCGYYWASTTIGFLIFSDPTCISIQTVLIHWCQMPYTMTKISIIIPKLADAH